jgi:hypothetical protein
MAGDATAVDMALAAFSELQPRSPVPDSVTVVATKRWKEDGSKEPYVVRLLWSDSHPIIAKACPQDTGRLEAFMYGTVLPAVPITRPRFHGAVERDPFVWLFLEDVGIGERFSLRRHEHQALISSWMATLHLEGHGGDLQKVLPARDVAYYRTHLDEALANLGNRDALHIDTPEDLTIVNRVEEAMRRLDEIWGQLGNALKRIPVSVIHGDLVAKNVRVVRENSGLTLAAFDWSMAGWGTVAPDLGTARIDQCQHCAALYREIAGDSFGLSVEEVEHSARIGWIMRLVTSVSWASESLSTSDAPLITPDLNSYYESLQEALARVGGIG